jgi:hypothetical protein
VVNPYTVDALLLAALPIVGIGCLFAGMWVASRWERRRRRARPFEVRGLTVIHGERDRARRQK